MDRLVKLQEAQQEGYITSFDYYQGVLDIYEYDRMAWKAKHDLFLSLLGYLKAKGSDRLKVFCRSLKSEVFMQTVKDAKIIINELVKVLNPEKRVREILRKQKEKFQEKKLHVLSIGKAAWDMAAAAHTELGNRIEKGIVITKYDHSRGRIGDFEIFEAGHPVPDEMSVQAAKRAVEVFGTLGEKDLLIFLISGGWLLSV